MGYTLLFSEITPYFPLLFKGLGLSIVISTIGMVLGCILGVFSALGRISSQKVLQKITNVYVDVFRNTPLLIQMYLIYFGLGQFGIQIPPFYSALISITLNNGAYTAVIFQTGIEAVDDGQREAAAALGLDEKNTFRYVILPQAIKTVFAPLTNQFINLFLFSSVASSISVNELTYQTMYVEAYTMRSFETFIITTLLYLAFTTIISILTGLYEKVAFKY